MALSLLTHRRAHVMRTVMLGSLLWATPLSGPAQSTPEDASGFVIRALEHKWAESQASKDNGALALIFDNALVYVEYGHILTKGEYLSRIKAAAPNPSQVTMEAMTVHTFGSTAIVVGTYHETIVTDKVAHLRRWRFLDTWVYKNGRWVLVAAGSSPSSK